MGEMSNDQVMKRQPLILAIETATRAGGVAVARGEAVLASIGGDPSISHSTNLLEMVETALRNADVTMTEVDLFAVAVGPGSFTGLRIGVATAKAFAVHLHRRVLGVATLAAVAHASGFEGQTVSLLPAGRGEVFAQRFKVQQGVVTPIDEPQHLSPREVIDKYASLEAVRFAGEGVRMLQEQLAAGENSESIVSEIPILAASVAVLAAREYQQGRAVAPEDLHAVYVRASDAEINERWQQQKLQQLARN
jgi:tRNA threonylcarbamoyladenosine biosynthesis protein TsaB